MSADPFQVLPGDVITYSVAITNVADGALLNVVLSDPLPAGMVYVAQSASGFSYSARDKRLTWTLQRIAPGQAVRGGFQLRATGLAIGELVVNTVSAVSANAPVVTASAVVEVAPPRQNQVWTTPAEGGWLRSEDGRVDLRVPPGAMMRRTELIYTAQPTLPTEPAGMIFALGLNARDEVGQVVGSFQRPVRLRIWNARMPRSSRVQGDVSLVYFDDASQVWLPLETETTGLAEGVAADIDAPGVFALLATSAESDRVRGLLIPSVLGAQNNLWTGDSAFSYALEMPPAPGSGTPSLALSYSSGAANGMVEAHDNDRLGQPSDFGLGWDLAGSGAITRSGERYFLQFPGGSFQLTNTAGANWKTVPESFLQISHDPGGPDNYRTEPVYGFCTNGQQGWIKLTTKDTASWTVRTPDGATFVFGGSVNGIGVPLDPGATAFTWEESGISEVPSNCSGNSGNYRGTLRLRPYRWNLITAQPAVGSGWSYQYDHKSMRLRFDKQHIITETIYDSAMNDWERRSIMHTWLKQIEYGNAHNLVDVTYVLPDGQRSDKPTGFEWNRVWVQGQSKPADWDTQGYTALSQWLVSDKIVDDISIQARTSTNQPWRTVRVYDLSHNRTLHHLALAGVVERNAASAALPATTFVYQANIGGKRNAEALAEVNNSQGGQVRFTYVIKPCGADLTCPTSTPQAPQNGRIVVEKRTVSPMPGQDEAEQHYAYTGGRYVRPGNDWQFWGFGTVTERLYTPGVSTPLRKTVTLFNQVDEQRKGKVNQVTTYVGESGPELTRTVNT